MKHLYKSGGDWKTKSGASYTVKAFNKREVNEAINNGWCLSLDDATAIEAVFTEDKTAEKSLREEIKKLGGKPAGRSSIAKLEAQLEGLKDGDTNEG